MEQVTMIGLDIAKRAFQVHGVDAPAQCCSAIVLFAKLISFLAAQMQCVVAWNLNASKPSDSRCRAKQKDRRSSRPAAFDTMQSTDLRDSAAEDWGTSPRRRQRIYRRDAFKYRWLPQICATASNPSRRKRSASASSSSRE